MNLGKVQTFKPQQQITSKIHCFKTRNIYYLPISGVRESLSLTGTGNRITWGSGSLMRHLHWVLQHCHRISADSVFTQRCQEPSASPEGCLHGAGFSEEQPKKTKAQQVAGLSSFRFHSAFYFSHTNPGEVWRGSQRAVSTRTGTQQGHCAAGSYIPEQASCLSQEWDQVLWHGVDNFTHTP